MKRIGSYLAQYKKETILAPVFKMLEAVLELCVPLLVARMIDMGVVTDNRMALLRDGLLLLLLGIVGLIVSVIAQYFAAEAAVRSSAALRQDLFAHIQTLTWSQIDTLGTSTLINRMTGDIQLVQNGINMFLRLFLRSPFVVFGALVMAILVDHRMSLIFFLVIPVLLVLIFAILLTTMPQYARVQGALDNLTRRTRETLTGVRVVRAFHRQEAEQDAFVGDAEDLYRKQMRVGGLSAFLNPLTTVIINLGLIAILYFGDQRLAASSAAGSLTIGGIVALLNYMSTILVELIKLANLVILLSRAAAASGRIDRIFACKNPQQDGSMEWPDTQEKGATISFSHVTYTYPGDNTPALQDLQFSVPAGSTLGIIGGTGAGKSTLVHLIPRFYEPDSGQIDLQGIPLSRLRIASLRKHIGLVPQMPALVRGTLRENLLWGDKAADDTALLQTLRIAQATDFTGNDVNALSQKVEQDGRNFSGGQKQRLAIARALVRKPAILILDDSSSALDYATDAALRKALRTSVSGSTVLLVSQRVATVRQADRILVLEEGHQVGFGTHEDLLATCPAYRDICASQEAV